MDYNDDDLLALYEALEGKKKAQELAEKQQQQQQQQPDVPMMEAYDAEPIAKTASDTSSSDRSSSGSSSSSVSIEELPSTREHRASARIVAAPAVTALSAAAEAVPFLFRRDALAQQAARANSVELIEVLSRPTPAASLAALPASDARIQRMPKRMADAVLSDIHSEYRAPDAAYALSFELRVQLVTEAAEASHFGSPFSGEYPDARRITFRDKFAALVRAAEPVPPRTVEAFANHVPTWLTEAQALELRRLHRSRYDTYNEGELSRALFEIGYGEQINDLDLAELLEPARAQPEPVHRAAADKFLASATQPAFVFNALKLAAVAGVFVYGAPLGSDSSAVRRLVEACRTELVLALSVGDAATAFPEMLSEYRKRRFFSMKRFQSVEQLRRDSFFFRDTGACPLFTKYSHARLISSGGYGFVVSFLPREQNPVPGPLVSSILAGAPLEEKSVLFDNPQLVAKFQAVEPVARGSPVIEDETAYIELRVMHIIAELLTRHWPPERRVSGVYNHVRLDDWVRCEFDARTAVAPLLKGESAERIQKAVPAGKKLYQIIVQEYAAFGDLGKCMSAGGLTTAARFASAEMFCSLAIQVLGFIQSLRGVAYSHNDVKPFNILLQPLPPAHRAHYFAYMGVASGARRDLYVPTWGPGLVAKLADQGFAVIYGRRRLAGGAQATAYIPSAGNRRTLAFAYNPAFDLECYALNYLSSMLRAFRTAGVALDGLHEYVDPEPVAWIRNCIHEPPYVSPAAEKCYASVTAFLDAFLDFSLTSAPLASRGFTYSSLIESLDDLYSKHNSGWRAEKRPGYDEAISRALADPLFDAYREAPAGEFTPENGGVVVMSDYHF